MKFIIQKKDKIWVSFIENTWSIQPSLINEQNLEWMLIVFIKRQTVCFTSRINLLEIIKNKTTQPAGLRRLCIVFESLSKL